MKRNRGKQEREPTMLSHLIIARAALQPTRPSLRKHASFSCQMERWGRQVSAWFGS